MNIYIIENVIYRKRMKKERKKKCSNVVAIEAKTKMFYKHRHISTPPHEIVHFEICN